MNNQIKKEIFNAIRGNTGPMSIGEISKLTGYSKPTTGKYVDILLEGKKITVDETRPPYRLVQRIEITR